MSSSNVVRYLKRIPGLRPMARAIRHRWAMSRFHGELAAFRAMNRRTSTPDRLAVLNDDLYPCLEDRTSDTPFEPHYTYHTAWAARVLVKTRPEMHIDIASSLFFVGIASAFVPMQFYDYRPANLRLPGLTTHAGDILKLPFADHSIRSLSCLHVLEHIGLGRYGDPLDPDGDLKAMAELQRVLAPNGDLLMVLPVGKPRVCFNAHRVYSYRQVLDGFHELKLLSFSMVPDDGVEAGLIDNASASQVAQQSFGCGCFWFRREAP